MIRFYRDTKNSKHSSVVDADLVIEGEYEVITDKQTHIYRRHEKDTDAPERGDAPQTSCYVMEKRRTRDRRKVAQSFFPIETRINDRRKHSQINIKI
jgi:hypothetical protein